MKYFLLSFGLLLITSLGFAQCAADQTITNTSFEICAGDSITINVENSEPGVRYIVHSDDNCAISDSIMGDGNPMEWKVGPFTDSTSVEIIAQFGGDYKSALEFDGTDDRINLGSPAALNFHSNDQFTIETWIKLSSSTGDADYPQIISNYNPATYQGWSIQVTTGGRPEFWCAETFAAPGSYIFTRGQVDMRDDQWHHLAISYDGSAAAAGVKFYYDGHEVESEIGVDQLTGNFGGETQPVYLGGDVSGSSYFLNGAVDEMRIWNGVRSKSEICSNLRNFYDDSEPNLLALWDFNEGSGSTANDGAVNAINGTLTGMEPTDWIVGAIDSVICTSVLSQTIDVNVNNQTTNIDMILCSGDSLFLEGEWRKFAGTFTDTLSSVLLGCDSIRIANVTVATPDFTSTDQNLCNGDSIYLENAWRFDSGTFYDTLTSVLKMCDSIIETNLTLLAPLDTGIIELSICSGDSILIAGNYEKSAGDYFQTYLSSSIDGCDTTVRFVLSINPTYNTPIDTSICQGDSIMIGGAYYSEGGMYYDSLQSTLMCDSVLVYNLMLNTLPDVSTSLMEGSTYCTFALPINITPTVAGGTLSGEGVSGSTIDPSLVVSDSVFVVYEITDNNNCSNIDSTKIYFDACLGTNNVAKVGFTIFPNPNNGKFTISIEDNFDEIQLFDITGKTLYSSTSQHTNNKTLELNAPKGIYFVQLTKGEAIITEKIVVE